MTVDDRHPLAPDEMKAVLNGSGWNVTQLIKENHPAYVAVIEKA